MTVLEEDFQSVGEQKYMQYSWEPETLLIFKKCLDAYLVILQSKSNSGTRKINDEIRRLKNIKIIIRRVLKNADERLVDLKISFGDYQLLSDILWKYWAAANQILRKKRENVMVEGELENDEAELERLTTVLKLPIFEKIPRRKILVDNLLSHFDPDFKVNKSEVQSKNKQEERIEKTDFLDKYDLHPEIKRVAINQFQDGYYKEAVQNAFVEVIDQVKQKTKYPKKERNGKEYELDGDELMQYVFGCDGDADPIIKFNGLANSLERAEQRGFMHLFKGIVGLRDKKAHLNDIQKDPVKSLEYLSLASLLLRLLDENTK
ncbi:MAG: TIGR02391 family protein [Patescibacteria group bacterium]